VKVLLYVCLQLSVLWLKARTIPADLYPSKYRLLNKVLYSFV